MVRFTFLAGLLGATLTSCELSVQDHGPPLVSINVPIAPTDVPRILSVSKRFASHHGLSFGTTGGEGRFTVFMQRDELGLHAHNMVEVARAHVGASDDGKMRPDNIRLAQQYVDLIRRTSSRMSAKGGVRLNAPAGSGHTALLER